MSSPRCRARCGRLFTFPAVAVNKASHGLRKPELAEHASSGRAGGARFSVLRAAAQVALERSQQMELSTLSATTLKALSLQFNGFNAFYFPKSQVGWAMGMGRMSLSQEASRQTKFISDAVSVLSVSCPFVGQGHFRDMFLLAGSVRWSRI